jgi:hypothetical protein
VEFLLRDFNYTRVKIVPKEQRVPFTSPQREDTKCSLHTRKSLNYAAMNATNNDATPVQQPLQVFHDPRNDPECFPKIEEFTRALQDPGETPTPKKHANKTGTSASPTSSSRTDDGVVIV